MSNDISRGLPPPPPVSRRSKTREGVKNRNPWIWTKKEQNKGVKDGGGKDPRTIIDKNRDNKISVDELVTMISFGLLFHFWRNIQYGGPFS